MLSFLLFDNHNSIWGKSQFGKTNREIIKNAGRGLGSTHVITKIKSKHQITTTGTATSNNSLCNAYYVHAIF